MTKAGTVPSTERLRTSEDDGDLSHLTMREINSILAIWSRQRALGIPAQKRLAALLEVLRADRLEGGR